jgi:hypothetical protein
MITQGDTMKKLLSAIWSYLKDWKNLLAHSIIGILILVIALFLPVKPIYRLVVLVAVVLLNTLRMKLDKKAKAAKAVEATQGGDATSTR